MANKTLKVKTADKPQPIPVGMYDAKLASWEEKTGGQFGDYIRMTFEITDGDHAGTERSLIASAKLTKGSSHDTTSKLYKALTGLMGKEPETDEEISLDDLVGNKCKILVENKPGEEGWQDITKVMPA